MNPYLPPGVSEETMARMAREHDVDTCSEGNNGDRCAECAAELAEIEFDAHKETHA